MSFFSIEILENDLAIEINLGHTVYANVVRFDRLPAG